MNDEEKIKELYRRYWTYMINKDEKGLKGLLADDYYLLHMTDYYCSQPNVTFLSKNMKPV